MLLIIILNNKLEIWSVIQHLTFRNYCILKYIFGNIYFCKQVTFSHSQKLKCGKLVNTSKCIFPYQQKMQIEFLKRDHVVT